MSERCGPDSESILCYARVARAKVLPKIRGWLFDGRLATLSTIGPTSFVFSPPEAEADNGTAAEEDELLLGS